ncbi:hypothetical protein EV714DRAFT_276516 [Schizophyllum commune]
MNRAPQYGSSTPSPQSRANSVYSRSDTTHSSESQRGGHGSRGATAPGPGAPPYSGLPPSPPPSGPPPTWPTHGGTGTDHSHPSDEEIDDESVNIDPRFERPDPEVTAPLKLVIPAIFVDNLVSEMRLEKEQADYMHMLLQMGSLPPNPLSKADLSCRLLNLGAIYQEAAARRRQERSEIKDDSLTAADMLRMMKDLQIRLDEEFTLTKTQRACSRAVCMDELYKPTRTAFKSLHHDVLKRLTKDAELYKLGNVVGDPSRELVLARLVKRQASSVRNGFREDTVKSTSGTAKQLQNLDVFTAKTADKYMMGRALKDLSPAVTVRNAVLRRFVMDHPEIAHAPEPEEPEDGAQEGEGGSQDGLDGPVPPRPSKRTADGAAKKQGGRVPESIDFWACFEAWLAEAIVKRGRDLTSEAWKPYITETVDLDNARFKVPRKPSSSAQQVGPGMSGAASMGGAGLNVRLQASFPRKGMNLMSMLNN